MEGAAREEPDDGLLIRAIAAHDGILGDPRRYGPIAADVVSEARDRGDTEALVVGLRAAAWFERSRLENATALRLLKEASALARRARLTQRHGEVLVTRAAVNLELGRFAAAARDLARADGLVDPGAAPDLELKRAALLHNTGRIRAAADVYRRILADHAAPVDVRARAATNLSLAESLRGRSREAAQHVDTATLLAAEVGPALVAIVAHNRGSVLAEGGRLAEGLRQIDAAAELLVEAGLPLGEYLVDHAETLAGLRVLPEAAALARRAADELDAHDVPLMAAQARLKVAQIALLVGDGATACAEAERAAAQFRQQRRAGWHAQATVVAAQARVGSDTVTPELLGEVRRAADVLGRLGLTSGAVGADLTVGRVARALGRAGTARRRFRAAFERSRGGPVLVRLRGRLAAALAAELDGDGRAVLAHCRAGQADLAKHRAALGSMELRALASGHGLELGFIGLDVLLRTDAPARVLDWAERTRGVALLTFQPPAPDAAREERAELAAVQAEIACMRRETGEEPTALVARQTAIENRIRRATWSRGATGDVSARPVRTAELPALLGDQTLVSYGRQNDELYVVVVARSGRRLLRLGPWAPIRFEADALLFALRRLTHPGAARSVEGARASAEHALRTLTERLVRPLGVAPDASLVVIPARDTHRIPWSALHHGPVTLGPSASLWARTATGAVPETDRVVIVGGPGLPGAEREVEAVAASYAHATVLVPPKSTPEAVLQAIAAADLVHLACHGRLRADNPTFSALELTDGQLTVHELDLRGIAPRRIVLAACDSAADISYAGDELLGFVSALLARGTAGLVASVVAVGDVEAVALMRALHEALAAGLTMADALHTARATIDTADPRAFVNWCAFTAYGAG